MEEFERLSAPLKGICEESLIGAFRVALKPEIIAELRLTSAVTLGEIMEMAIRVEERNMFIEGAKENRVTRSQRYPSGPKSDPAVNHYTRVTHLPET